MATALDDLFVKVRSENRAALIAYIPAGFPSIEGCKKVIKAFVDGGVDAIEIGFPYSDPVMDGPTIQAAADQSLSQGTGAGEVFDALKTASGLGVAAVVMTYWNPIEKYGVEKFAQAIINDVKQDQLDTLVEILDSVEDQLTSKFLLNEIEKIKLELGK